MGVVVGHVWGSIVHGSAKWVSIGISGVWDMIRQRGDGVIFGIRGLRGRRIRRRNGSIGGWIAICKVVLRGNASSRD